MWLKKTDPKEKEQAPEKLRYSRYYEHDGALRAYANRAMVLAFICVPTTLLALAHGRVCASTATYRHSG